jgi:uncharacterized protein YkwD
MKTSLLTSLLILVCSFTTISCSNDSDELNDSNAAIINDFVYSDNETQLFDAINDYRISQGKNPLILVNHISYKSQEHNLYMIDKNVVNHDFFSERSNNIIAVLGAVKVAENIAYNYNNANSVLHAWLNSPDHKENLDGNYTHIGISIAVNPINGKKYYTNMFMR